MKKLFLMVVYLCAMNRLHAMERGGERRQRTYAFDGFTDLPVPNDKNYMQKPAYLPTVAKVQSKNELIKMQPHDELLQFLNKADGKSLKGMLYPKGYTERAQELSLQSIKDALHHARSVKRSLPPEHAYRNPENCKKAQEKWGTILILLARQIAIYDYQKLGMPLAKAEEKEATRFPSLGDRSGEAKSSQ